MNEPRNSTIDSDFDGDGWYDWQAAIEKDSSSTRVDRGTLKSEEFLVVLLAGLIALPKSYSYFSAVWYFGRTTTSPWLRRAFFLSQSGRMSGIVGGGRRQEDGYVQVYENATGNLACRL